MSEPILASCRDQGWCSETSRKDHGSRWAPGLHDCATGGQLIKKSEDISDENIALGNAFADLAYDHHTLLDQKDEGLDAEVTAMLEALRGLATGEEGIHTRDPFYCISHHTLLRQKSQDQVKALLRYVDRHYSNL